MFFNKLEESEEEKDNNFSPALKFTLLHYNCYSAIVINQIVQSEGKASIKQDDSFSHSLKGWLTGFFLGLIVFMGCCLTCVHASFFKKCIIFHIIYLYSTPLCPFSDKRLDLFPGL